jgi:zinc/manganese transport system substrate-binding protein
MRRDGSRATRFAVAAMAATAVLGTVTACGGTAASAAGGSSSSFSGVDVVASTNVWGSIAAAIGGNRARVSSVISDPSADPHSFEADAHVQLAISRADVVIENGGGYDDFMRTLVSAAGSKAHVIDAVAVTGAVAAAKAAHEQLNEHVWYDLPAVGRVSDAIVAALSAADPAGAATFRANGKAFRDGLAGLIAREGADRARTQGAGVLVTEPVPLDMLRALGAVDRTPSAFSEAVENGSDVPPTVLEQTENLLSGGSVTALVVNEQTTGAQTQQVEKAARRHSVAVVPVRETLPRGQTYLSWMKANLDALTTALSS